jgi:hypothetical protein
MQEVLSKLPNVSEYHITWADLPVSCLAYNPAYLFSSIFRSAPIRRLTIAISLENLSALDAQVFSKLSSIEQLRMVLHSEIATSTDTQADTDSDSDTLVPSDMTTYSTTDFLTFSSSSSTLATAINYIRHTLKSLEIEIRGPSPLGSFLPLIDHLPHLEKLLVTLPIDGDIQFDNHHSALSTFIDRHSTSLRALALRAEQPIFSSLGRRRGGSLLKAAYNDDDDDAGDPFFLDTRFQQSLRNIRQTRIRSLDLTTTHIPIDTCLACIRTFRSSLVSLSVTGQYQSLSFIEEVLDEFEVEGGGGGLLRELRLGTVVLTPGLMDLLAEKVPGLQKLCLLVKDVASPSSSPSSSPSLECRERREEQIVSVCFLKCCSVVNIE